MIDNLKLYWNLLVHGRPALQEALAQKQVIVDEAHKAGVRTAGFWLTAITGVSSVALQVGGFVPPPYGAVVLAVSGALYQLSRGLKKRDDELGGLKPALATSEAWVGILGAAAQGLLGLKGAVSPDVAMALASLSAGMVTVADNLAKSGAQPPAAPANETP